MWDGGRTKLKLYWCQHYPLRTFLLSIFWLAPKWRLGISDYDKWWCRAWSDNLQCPVLSSPAQSNRCIENWPTGPGQVKAEILREKLLTVWQPLGHRQDGDCVVCWGCWAVSTFISVEGRLYKGNQGAVSQTGWPLCFISFNGDFTLETSHRHDSHSNK